MLGPSLSNTMIAIGIVYTPVYARLARSMTMSIKRREFIEAAFVAGSSKSRVLLRHIFPNITAPLIIQASLSLSLAILTEASLSFLGLGTQPPNPSWGTMVATGQRLVELSPWQAVFPGFAIVLTVLGFNLVGDGLRDALDPRQRS
jgi:peptide/nickel transport system permease protein